MQSQIRKKKTSEKEKIKEKLLEVFSENFKSWKEDVYEVKVKPRKSFKYWWTVTVKIGSPLEIKEIVTLYELLEKTFQKHSVGTYISNVKSNPLETLITFEVHVKPW